MEIVAADIGGTHARFALATIEDRKVRTLDAIVTLRTADYPGLDGAWKAYAVQVGRPLPRALALAVACPVAGETLRLTNNPWTIRTARISADLGVDNVLLLNDFEANAHAIGALAAADLVHICGPPAPLPDVGVISVVGPGTGLGVAYVVRGPQGDRVVACEGGHVGYPPRDAIEDAILVQLRARYGRVSTERVASGPGLLDIYTALASIEGHAVEIVDDRQLWGAALEGSDARAAAALERFVSVLGNVASDVSLVHGSAAVVLVGSLANQLRERLSGPTFTQAFLAKGRHRSVMEGVLVSLATHAHLGLLGAAVAFAASA